MVALQASQLHGQYLTLPNVFCFGRKKSSAYQELSSTFYTKGAWKWPFATWN